MQLTSEVIAVRSVLRGESVGYGGRWTAQRDSVVATVPVGYGDGYPWAATDGTPVGINGGIAPLAGRVSMDMLTVDVTDCGDISLGTPVTLWGDQPQIDEVARHSGTIGYELMTRLTARTPRRYHT
jgi:alanine racemase